MIQIYQYAFCYCLNWQWNNKKIQQVVQSLKIDVHSAGSETQVKVTHITKVDAIKSNRKRNHRLVDISKNRADVLISCASSNTRWQSSWDWWARIVIKPASEEDKCVNTGLRADFAYFIYLDFRFYCRKVRINIKPHLKLLIVWPGVKFSSKKCARNVKRRRVEELAAEATGWRRR